MSEISSISGRPLMTEAMTTRPLPSGALALNMDARVAGEPFAKQSNDERAASVAEVVANFKVSNSRTTSVLGIQIDMGTAQVNGKTYDVDIQTKNDKQLTIHIVDQSARENQIYIELDDDAGEVDISFNPSEIYDQRSSNTGQLIRPGFESNDLFRRGILIVPAPPGNGPGSIVIPETSEEYHMWANRLQHLQGQ